MPFADADEFRYPKRMPYFLKAMLTKMPSTARFAVSCFIVLRLKAILEIQANHHLLQMRAG